MRDSGKASKIAMQSVINDISNYSEIVYDELNFIMKEVEILSISWKDDKFKEFIECMDRMKSSVDFELRVINNTKYELEKKVGMM